MRVWLDTIEQAQKLEASRNQELIWRSLRLFLLYRVLLAIALLFTFHSGAEISFLGKYSADLLNIG